MKMKSTEVKDAIEKLDHFTALDLLEVFYRDKNNGGLPQLSEDGLLPVGGAVLEAYKLDRNASTLAIKDKIMEIIEESGYDEGLLEMVRYIPFKLMNTKPELADYLATLFPYKTELQRSFEATVSAGKFILN